MEEPRKNEVSVLSGEEGRFLEWSEDSGEWKAFNYHNYRHFFEESPLGEADYVALRSSFKLFRAEISDEVLARMSPKELNARIEERA